MRREGGQDMTGHEINSQVNHDMVWYYMTWYGIYDMTFNKEVHTQVKHCLLVYSFELNYGMSNLGEAFNFNMPFH